MLLSFLETLNLPIGEFSISCLDHTERPISSPLTIFLKGWVLSVVFLKDQSVSFFSCCLPLKLFNTILNQTFFVFRSLVKISLITSFSCSVPLNSQLTIISNYYSNFFHIWIGFEVVGWPRLSSPLMSPVQL